MQRFSFETVSKSSKTNALCLWFVTEPEITIERTLFQSTLLEDPILSVRGKSPGAFAGASTFQWYLGPQALAVFLLRAKLAKAHAFLPVLEGTAGTVAACLNDAIEKTSWIHDLFGCQSDGTSIVRRLVNRSNYRRRGSVSVAISLNEKFLKANDVNVFLDGLPVLAETKLRELADEVEAIWSSKKSLARSRAPQELQIAA